MSRSLRIEIENGLYHVTSRGWERRVIVRDDRDREQWNKLVDRVVTRFGWRVFAWALMDNHFHLFLQTPDANLSAGMHDLNSGFATWFNRRHRRVGSLFQGRFKAILVEDESYSWTLSRYIHLNPVRAKLVRRPEDHRWSSYQYFLRSRKAPKWLDWQTVLAEIGKQTPAARREYRRFVEAGIRGKPDSPLKDVVGEVLLGSAEWVERMRKKLASDDIDDNVPVQRQLAWRPPQQQIESAGAEEFGVDPYRLFAKRIRNNEARAATLFLIRRLTSVSATTLADQYGDVSQAAISKTIQRAEIRSEEQRSWKRKLRRLEKSLRNKD